MIEYIALVIAIVALALNVLFVRKIGKFLQAANAFDVAFNLTKKDAQEARKTVEEAKYWLEQAKKGKV